MHKRDLILDLGVIEIIYQYSPWFSWIFWFDLFIKENLCLLNSDATEINQLDYLQLKIRPRSLTYPVSMSSLCTVLKLQHTAQKDTGE